MGTARTLLCVVLAAASAASAAEPEAKKDSPGTIVHSVYFWLKDTATKEDAENLIRDSRKLLAPLPCVKRLDIGKPLGTGRGVVDGSYHVGLVVTFDDQTGYDTYVKHPNHLKLVETYKALWQKIIVYDFLRE